MREKAPCFCEFDMFSENNNSILDGGELLHPTQGVRYVDA